MANCIVKMPQSSHHHSGVSDEQESHQVQQDYGLDNQVPHPMEGQDNTNLTRQDCVEPNSSRVSSNPTSLVIHPIIPMPISNPYGENRSPMISLPAGNQSGGDAGTSLPLGMENASLPASNELSSPMWPSSFFSPEPSGQSDTPSLSRVDIQGACGTQEVPNEENKTIHEYWRNTDESQDQQQATSERVIHRFPFDLIPLPAAQELWYHQSQRQLAALIAKQGYGGSSPTLNVQRDISGSRSVLGGSAFAIPRPRSPTPLSGTSVGKPPLRQRIVSPLQPRFPALRSAATRAFRTGMLPTDNSRGGGADVAAATNVVKGPGGLPMLKPHADNTTINSETGFFRGLRRIMSSSSLRNVSGREHDSIDAIITGEQVTLPTTLRSTSNYCGNDSFASVATSGTVVHHNQPITPVTNMRSSGTFGGGESYNSSMTASTVLHHDPSRESDQNVDIGLAFGVPSEYDQHEPYDDQQDANHLVGSLASVGLVSHTSHRPLLAPSSSGSEHEQQPADAVIDNETDVEVKPTTECSTPMHDNDCGRPQGPTHVNFSRPRTPSGTSVPANISRSAEQIANRVLTPFPCAQNSGDACIAAPAPVHLRSNNDAGYEQNMVSMDIEDPQRCQAQEWRITIFNYIAIMMAALLLAIVAALCSYIVVKMLRNS